MSRLYLKTKWAKELLMRQEHLTTGTTFYVDANTGNDSGSGLYPFDAKLTIQSAVDAVTSDRGDVVIVGAGRYYENVRITKSKMRLMGAQIGGKQSVSIRAAGAGTAAAEHAEAPTLYGYSSLAGEDIRGACVTVNAASVEICGLEFDASDYQYTTGSYYHYTGLYIGDGTRISASYNYDCNGSYIHDCIFKRGYYGINYDGSSEDHRCLNNLFYRNGGATTRGCIFVDPGSSRHNSRMLFKDNVFMAMADLGYGIYLYPHDETHDIIIAHNIFHERDGKTVAYAIRTTGAGEHLIAGNWFGCANKVFTVATDWTSGNYIGTAGKAGAVTAFVTED